jgi:hypothetical protein
MRARVQIPESPSFRVKSSIVSVHLPLMLVAFVSPKESVGGPGGRSPAPLASFISAPVWRVFGVDIIIMPLKVRVAGKGLLRTFGVAACDAAVLVQKANWR